MKKTLFSIGILTMGLMATDFASMTTDELIALRGTVAIEDRADFREEMQSRIASMNKNEIQAFRASLQQRNGRQNNVGRGNGRQNSVGRGNGRQNSVGRGNGRQGAGTFDINSYPMSNLTQESKDAVGFMKNEERLAYDVYMGLYNYHSKNSNNSIQQFKNIATRSEVNHIQITLDMAKKYSLASADSSEITIEELISPEKMGEYDLPVIQELYNTLMEKGKASTKDALEVGCIIEVVDVEDLNARIATTEKDNATDIVAGFNILRDGSYRHYWAFDRGLKNLGYPNGCNLGTSQVIDGHTYKFNDKNGIYPQ